MLGCRGPAPLESLLEDIRMSSTTTPISRLALRLALVAALVTGLPRGAFAWGDEGHEIIALVADHFLASEARQKIAALLATDDDELTAHDMASEATWADKYAQSDRDTTRQRYDATYRRHFVNLELAGPDLDAACYGHPAVAPGRPAAQGPAADCIVDKIDQFEAELAAPGTPAAERLLAFKFLLHFIGDLHQPLHASDDHDAGGGKMPVAAPDIEASNLHIFWDVDAVRQLGSGAVGIAGQLIAGVTPEEERHWCRGNAADWALETFGVGRDHAYGRLPPAEAAGVRRLDAAYRADAGSVAAGQLAKAGVRLACVLNKALAAGASPA
jgi:hypothetical protein